MGFEIDRFYEERKEIKSSGPLNLRTIIVAVGLHLAAFVLFWIAAKIIYREPEVVIPIDMTIVPPWAEQDPDDPEPDPNPPPEEEKKPEPPKPEPKPEPEPPKEEPKEKVEAVIAKARLSNVAKQTIDTLSKGFRQRTCFAQAILHDPKVLIMDEPTDGLDPNQKYVVREMIKEMSADKAIIISTHILEEVDAVCSRAVVIAHGELKADGTPAELKAMDPSGKLDVVFRNLTMEKEGV